MTWDYYIHVEQKIEAETSSLSQLEARLETANRRERRQVRGQIEEKVNNTCEAWRQDIGDDLVRTLVTQLLDDVSTWWFVERFPCKEEARTKVYIPITQKLTISDPGKVCEDIDFRLDFQNLPLRNWLAFQVDFELLTPWYSKDDRVFHILDNPLRKDRVFGVPFMAASSWKGMLRWVFLLVNKLIGPEQEKDEAKREKAKAMELHLFGNEKDEEKNFHQGALVFYPTWFNKIGFEVINPHSRERRAGTKPIYYEVVPPGAKGTLSLLYAPWPGMKPSANPRDVLPGLLEAIETLLTTYGISAKRTVGWGTAKILEWRVYRKGKESQGATRGEWEKEKAESKKEFWYFFWEHKVLPLLGEECVS
ncbi:protein of unknown function DUF324 [Ammonifex degensii KC4]|uniref:CRISPR type III-associated protein domain-containing protein n=1 Tax=Ammonifex degensii (strain DSM 10501 / KC4) TaxID=429009 RepID=C9RCS2_AMMDK|nr:RAMP superfamily CRISPR-associated protein [Ammonifex degensii]ACX52049.1 protein of unknown function DUF324 [Ammonifex degensii KC4]